MQISCLLSFLSTPSISKPSDLRKPSEKSAKGSPHCPHPLFTFFSCSRREGRSIVGPNAAARARSRPRRSAPIAILVILKTF